MKSMRPKKLVGVYVIFCTRNGMQYVGSAVDVRRRWSTHRWALRHGKHRITELQADWDTYGEQAFEFKMLAEVPDAGVRRAIEQAYIDTALGEKSYNRSPSSLSNQGFKFTDDQRMSLSLAMAGKPKSEAHRAALSAAAVRHWANVPEQQRRDRTSAAGRGNLGKSKSEEHRRNIANGRGRLNEDQVREIKRRLAANEPTRTLADEFGVHISSISNIRRGRSWAHVTID